MGAGRLQGSIGKNYKGRSPSKKLLPCICFYGSKPSKIGMPPSALAAAKSSGVSVIGVYDKTSETDADRMRRELDGYVLDFAELEAMLSK